MAASPTPPSRRLRRLLVLGAAVAAVAVARDRRITATEHREAARLGLDADG